MKSRENKVQLNAAAFSRRECEWEAGTASVSDESFLKTGTGDRGGADSIDREGRQGKTPGDAAPDSIDNEKGVLAWAGRSVRVVKDEGVVANHWLGKERERATTRMLLNLS